jgi:hypothetical protein
MNNSTTEIDDACLELEREREYKYKGSVRMVMKEKQTLLRSTYAMYASRFTLTIAKGK